MPHAASRPTKSDTLRSAIASMGGGSELLQSLLKELEATRAERHALRQEKHRDQPDTERLPLLLDNLKHQRFGTMPEQLLRQTEQPEPELEKATLPTRKAP